MRRETAERLLDGRDDGSGVARLLAAAAEPTAGRPEDETAALAAYRRARAVRRERAAARGAASATAAARRGFTLKAVAGAAVSVLVLGGAAIAASGGELGGPFHRGHAAAPVTSVSASPSAPASAPTRGPSARPTAPPSAPAGAGRSATPRAGGGASPSPSPSGSGQPPAAAGLRGLCVAYLRDVSGAPGGRRLDPTSLARLTAAAGGPTRVRPFCTTLTPHPTPTPTPLLSLTLSLTESPAPR